MIKDGRQLTTDIAEIRQDHLRRYYWAVDVAKKYRARSIVDVGCGCGYGAWLLAGYSDATSVLGLDVDEATVTYARENWSHPRATFLIADLRLVSESLVPPRDLVVAFEVLEHTHFAASFLAGARRGGHARLLGSVPNQDAVPHHPLRNPHHVRHYTSTELQDLLVAAGWQICRLGSQLGKHGASASVDWTTARGRTLVFEAIPL